MRSKNLLIVCLISSLVFIKAAQTTGFVKAVGTDFVVNGDKFRFAGTNCYYLEYSDHFMVDDVLTTAARENFQVIRMWGFIDIGHQDGSGSVDHNGPIKDGYYFQYWDDVNKQPAYNDTNLINLDYAIAKAGSLGLRVLLTLTNNWSDFGGMDQYVQWRKWQDSSFSGYHDDFYHDSTIRQWYQDYFKHLATRKNTISGVQYMNDPTIFAWELANEPRCQGTGSFPTSNNCTLNYAVYGKDPSAWKILGWVDAMSTYIKSVDKNHMVATGDEGFLCERYQTCPDVTCDCYYGVDSMKFTQTKNIDYMSLHLYPDQWGKNVDWATDYIKNHTHMAHNIIGKPVVLGEYGYKNNQDQVYTTWTDAVYSSGMNGDNFWMISGKSDGGGNNGWVPNYDGYAVYCPESTSGPKPPGDPKTCPVLSSHASKMKSSTIVIE